MTETPTDGGSTERPGRRWTVETKAILGHPLVLLVATAIISGLLVPRLTAQWQERDQQLDVRKDLAARVSRTVGELFTATQFAQVKSGRAPLPADEQQRLDDAYRKWLVESAVLAAELTAYYRNDALEADWQRCELVTEAHYAQLGRSDPSRRRAYLTAVATEARYPATVDLTDDAAMA